MASTVSIITVTLNIEVFADDYFKAIFSGTILPHEVLIYDGGSKDKTIEIIKKYQLKYPAIKLTQGDNVGFAEGNNILARQATGKFLFILNPDTKIDKDCLNLLLSAPGRETSILVPSQRTFDNKPIYHVPGMDIFGYPALHKHFFADGAAIFMPTEMFSSLGMFDPDYFVFQEDIDLSWRAHLRGIPLIMLPEAFIYHCCGGTVTGGAKKDAGRYTTTSFRRYLGEKNVLQNLLKNYSLPNLIWIFPLVLGINIAEFIFFTLTFNFKIAWCYVRAYHWVLINFRKLLKKRAIIQKTRTVGDREIFKKLHFGSSKLELLLKIGVPRLK